MPDDRKAWAWITTSTLEVVMLRFSKVVCIMLLLGSAGSSWAQECGSASLEVARQAKESQINRLEETVQNREDNVRNIQYFLDALPEAQLQDLEGYNERMYLFGQNCSTAACFASARKKASAYFKNNIVAKTDAFRREAVNKIKELGIAQRNLHNARMDLALAQSQLVILGMCQ